MNKRLFGIISIILIIVVVAGIGVSGCHLRTDSIAYENIETSDSNEGDYTVVGFSQLGAESDWRSANTESMKSTFTEENGYKLVFEDAQQKQVNQITAIRSFIQQEVDFIVLAPVTETGWDTVLTEAKEANIPVIIVDRMVDVESDDLYSAWVGSDFELEGRKVCEWLNSYTKAIGMPPEDINIVDIQGTLGSSAQLGRTRSFDKAAQEYGWNVVAYRMGDFTQTKGREAMLGVLQAYDNVNVVYCENDNEALGVLEALEASGKKVGSDIKNGEVMVISFDGVNEEARNNLRSGKISCIGQCNPISGPKVKVIIETIMSGEIPEKYEYMDECVYSSIDTVKSVNVDGIDYDITIDTK